MGDKYIMGGGEKEDFIILQNLTTTETAFDMHSWKPSMEEENGLWVSLWWGDDKQDMESK